MTRVAATTTAMRAVAVVVASLATLVACGARTSLEQGSAGASSPAALCGNGVLDPGEACDDGNTVDGDACRASCEKARCGDGVLWSGVEACDDGNVDDGDACPSTCGPRTCGDGVVQAGEGCDDGNRDDADACLTSCVPAFCGDGFVQRGVEQCDDSNAIATDACVACVPASCGDGFVWSGREACDDGNLVDDDECDDACHTPVCGDGRRAGHEECDLGAANADRPAFEVSQPSTPPFGTNALVRKESAVTFYDYSSASSHTGFEARSESRLYMYVDGATGRLSLFVTHGKDNDEPASQVDMDVTGIPPGFTIDVADDNGSEFFANGPSSAAGRWRFNQNSDGGVIGGLPFPGTWTLVVSPRFVQGISAWGFVKADLTRNALQLTEPVTIRAFDSRSTCRRNCTAPRCGDGVLDGGEVCDDGNVVGGDGCAADCHTVF